VANDYPTQCLQVLVVDGMSSDGTREIINEYVRRHPFMQLIDNPDRTVPHALNLGIRHSRGEYIIRLDAHSAYPQDYFTKLIEWHQRLKADNLGAVCTTAVLGKSNKAQAIKEVLSDPLGVGNSYFRTGSDRIREVDTVPFGCYRRKVFDRYGYFDERLIRNQDIELNKRIIEEGGKIYLVPDITCIYYAKDSLVALWKSSFANGLWNILTVYLTKKPAALSFRHFVPLLFLLSLVLPVLFSIILRDSRWLVVPMLSLISYVTLMGWKSLKLARQGVSFYHLFVSFLVLHFSYGCGSFLGLFRLDCLLSKKKDGIVQAVSDKN